MTTERNFESYAYNTELSNINWILISAWIKQKFALEYDLDVSVYYDFLLVQGEDKRMPSRWVLILYYVSKKSGSS